LGAPLRPARPMDMDLDKIQRLLEIVADSGMAEVKVV
jgi:hypothetical protein